MPVVKLDDHRPLTARLRDVLAPGQLESDKAARIRQVREYDVGRYRSQIKYAATRLAQIEGENAADEWLTQCMSKGVK
jgi:hypothetical protein